MNWAYRIPRFFFDEAATGTGGAPPPSGGSLAPSSTPAPSPTPPASPPASGAPSTTPAAAPGSVSSDPFSGLDGGFDDQDLDSVIVDGSVTDTGTPPSPAPAPVAAAAPAATPAPGTPPEVAPAPVAAAAPTSTSPETPRERLDQTIEGFKTNQAQLADWAATNLFALSAEDSAALVTNAEEIIPKLMGRAFAQANLAAMNAIRSLVPDLISHSVEAQHASRTKATKTLGDFYTAHADLNEKDHGATVASWAKQFRLANPTATRQQAFDYVSRAVRIQFGLGMPGAAPPAKPAPFAPARPGGRSPTPPTEHDPYAGLGMDLDE